VCYGGCCLMWHDCCCALHVCTAVSDTETTSEVSVNLVPYLLCKSHNGLCLALN
jgi:hypothetical protein